MTELEILAQLHQMAIESLPPDLFEQWAQIRNALLETRKALKDKEHGTPTQR